MWKIFPNFSAFYGYSHDVKMFIYLIINYEWSWGYKHFMLIISEKNCTQKLNLFLEELATHIFYFSIFPFWNLTCDGTAWTILIRVFERSTGSAFRTLNCILCLFYIWKFNIQFLESFSAVSCILNLIYRLHMHTVSSGINNIYLISFISLQFQILVKVWNSIKKFFCGNVIQIH